MQVCAEAGGGVVSVRDFVNIRHWAAVEGGALVSAGASVTHPAMPEVSGKNNNNNNNNNNNGYRSRARCGERTAPPAGP